MRAVTKRIPDTRGARGRRSTVLRGGRSSFLKGLTETCGTVTTFRRERELRDPRWKRLIPTALIFPLYVLFSVVFFSYSHTICFVFFYTIKKNKKKSNYQSLVRDTNVPSFIFTDRHPPKNDLRAAKNTIATQVARLHECLVTGILKTCSPKSWKSWVI